MGQIKKLNRTHYYIYDNSYLEIQDKAEIIAASQKLEDVVNWNQLVVGIIVEEELNEDLEIIKSKIIK